MTTDVEHITAALNELETAIATAPRVARTEAQKRYVADGLVTLAESTVRNAVRFSIPNALLVRALRLHSRASKTASSLDETVWGISGEDPIVKAAEGLPG